jgi:hypothetical protein
MTKILNGINIIAVDTPYRCPHFIIILKAFVKVNKLLQNVFYSSFCLDDKFFIPFHYYLAKKGKNTGRLQNGNMLHGWNACSRAGI